MPIIVREDADGFSTLGTGDDDIILMEQGKQAGTDTVHAGGGNDVVIGDTDVVHVDTSAANNTIATAQNIDTATSWNMQENPLVADDSVPYTTIVGQGDGEADFFAVTIGAGETLTADIDFGDGVYGGGAFDSTLALFDGSGARLAFDDDSGFGDGGLGSVNILDSLLTYTNTTGTAQTFYIKVDSFDATGVPVDATYLMNVSVTGHAATNTADQGADSINGEAGDDYLIGNGGNDTLIGGTGADFLDGGSGNDSLVGGTSDLADGVDTINGGAGNDTIIGGYYADILNGGSGDDVFQVFNDDNPGSIDGGADTDTFDASGVANLFLDLNLEAETVELTVVTNPASGVSGTIVNVENVIGTQNGDSITGDSIGNVLDGGGGNDTIIGGAGNDTLIGGLGNDSLDGGDDTDTADYSGAAGPINASISVSDNMTISGEGTDTITSTEVLIATDLGDTISAQLDFGASVYAGDGADSITTQGFGGDDTFSTFVDAGTGDDTVVMDDSQAMGNVDGGGDRDLFDASLFTSYGLILDLSNQTLDYFDDFSPGFIQADLLNFEDVIGTQKKDSIIGDGGGNVLDGGDGNDTISGGAGDDTLIGGLGNDSLVGGDDLDTADYSGLAGPITADMLGVTRTVTDAGDTDTLSGIEVLIGTDFNDTISSEMLDDHIIHAGDGDDLITVFTFPNSNASVDAGSGDDTVRMVDLALIGDLNGGTDVNGDLFDASAVTYAGMTINLLGGVTSINGVAGLENLLNFEHATGTQLGDVITGNGIGNRLDGQGGADSIDGGNGNDTILGGAGDDTLIGGLGNDSLVGGDDIDTADYSGLAGPITADMLGVTRTVTDAGSTDTLSGIEVLIGTDFNDTISSEMLDDHIIHAGDGDDLITVFTFPNSNASVDAGSGDDTVRMVDLALIGDLNGGTDVNGDLFDASAVTYSGMIIDLLNETSAFDGTGGFVNLSSLVGFEHATGTQKNDSITGDAQGNVLDGQAGNDTIIGGGGNDTIIGGLGADSLDGGAGFDDLLDYSGTTGGAAGALGSPGVAVDLSTGVVTGLAGNDTVAGFENVTGTQQGDTISGDGGANDINGEDGDDTLFGAGGADILDGGRGSDTLDGGAGDDLLFGGRGSDTLDGGAGDDLLFGGRDADLFIFSGGEDGIVDFFPGEQDMILINPELWSGTIASLLASATIVGGGRDLFLDLGAGNTLTLYDFTDVQGLEGRIGYNAEPDVGFDFDGDGTSDVLFRNPVNGQMALYLMDNGVPTAANIGGSNPAWEVIGTGDFTGDGTTDILWRNPADGKMGLYIMNDGAPSWKSLGGSNTAWDVAGTGDFDGDGTDDILWRNPTDGKMGLYLMEDGSQSWKALGGSNTAWDIVGTGDFNGDGTDDILWRNLGTGQMGMDLMDEGAKSWQKLGSSNTDWDVIGTGDFNGDGVDDILWRNLDDGEMGFYLMDESANKTWQKLGSSNPDWDVVGTGDYNGDGVDDLLWRNLDTGQMGMYLLDENANKTWQRLDDSNPNWNVEGYFDDVLA